MGVMPFIVFPPVGALIGALTNQIAIKMLFRPYHPWRLGRWRLPFTPGVIPQQRHVIAKNMAKTFEANLLSGQEIHRLITGDKVQVALEKKVDEFLQSLGPLAAMAAPQPAAPDPRTKTSVSSLFSSALISKDISVLLHSFIVIL